jgi:hypothetical protein
MTPPSNPTTLTDKVRAAFSGIITRTGSAVPFVYILPAFPNRTIEFKNIYTFL